MRCNGILVGFENLVLDESVLRDMKELGYDTAVTRRYLENCVRSEMTTAYYLLLKKRWRLG
jgi:hypothetical protein